MSGIRLGRSRQDLPRQFVKIKENLRQLPPLAPGAGLGHPDKAQDCEASMDYSKSGNPKNAKDKHAPLDLPKHGAPKAKTTEADKKAALLARMKAAAATRKD